MARSHTVLVVDDDPDIREMLTMILAAEGYSAIPAANGQEALARLAEETPCLILLDLMMPEMDGWAFRATQAEGPTRSIPLVVLSGGVDVEERARELGADRFLRKPVELQGLLEVVRRYCGPPA